MLLRSVAEMGGVMHVRRFEQTDPPCQQNSEDERDTEPHSIVRVELHLGKQIAERDADENPSRGRQRSTYQRMLISSQMIHSQHKREGPQRAHQRKAEVDQILRRLRPATGGHQTGNRHGIERFVQHDRQEDSESKQ